MMAMPQQQTNQHTNAHGHTQGLQGIGLHIRLTRTLHLYGLFTYRIFSAPQCFTGALQVALDSVTQRICLLAREAGSVLEQLFGIPDQGLQLILQGVLSGRLGWPTWGHGFWRGGSALGHGHLLPDGGSYSS
jgi:hypothetical protein